MITMDAFVISMIKTLQDVKANHYGINPVWKPKGYDASPAQAFAKMFGTDENGLRTHGETMVSRGLIVVTPISRKKGVPPYYFLKGEEPKRNAASDADKAKLIGDVVKNAEPTKGRATNRKATTAPATTDNLTAVKAILAQTAQALLKASELL